MWGVAGNQEHTTCGWLKLDLPSFRLQSPREIQEILFHFYLTSHQMLSSMFLSLLQYWKEGNMIFFKKNCLGSSRSQSTSLTTIIWPIANLPYKLAWITGVHIFLRKHDCRCSKSWKSTDSIQSQCQKQESVCIFHSASQLEKAHWFFHVAVEFKQNIKWSGFS